MPITKTGGPHFKYIYLKIYKKAKGQIMLKGSVLKLSYRKNPSRHPIDFEEPSLI